MMLMTERAEDWYRTTYGSGANPRDPVPMFVAMRDNFNRGDRLGFVMILGDDEGNSKRSPLTFCAVGRNSLPQNNSLLFYIHMIQQVIFSPICLYRDDALPTDYWPISLQNEQVVVIVIFVLISRKE